MTGSRLKSEACTNSRMMYSPTLNANGRGARFGQARAERFGGDGGPAAECGSVQSPSEVGDRRCCCFGQRTGVRGSDLTVTLIT